MAATCCSTISTPISGGRCTCLLGPSGVGKSSLLRLIAGLAPAGVGGEVTDGGRAGDRWAHRVDGQTEPLMPWLSARGNVAIGARLRGDPDYAQAVERADVLARVGLTAANATGRRRFPAACVSASPWPAPCSRTGPSC